MVCFDDITMVAAIYTKHPCDYFMVAILSKHSLLVIWLNKLVRCEQIIHLLCFALSFVSSSVEKCFWQGTKND